MAVHTFYLDTATATSPGWYGVLTESAPASANTLGVNTVGKAAVGTFVWAQEGGSTSSAANSTTGSTSLIDSKTAPTPGTGSAGGTVGDSMRTPTTLTGTFAAGNWTIAVSMRPTTVGMQGLIRCRVWRSANVDGSSATALTTSTLVGSTTAAMSSTTTTYTSSMTWAAPSITLTAQYLFFQIEFLEQTSAGSASLAKFALRVGTETSIVTTDLGSGEAPFMFPRSRHYVRR